MLQNSFFWKEVVGTKTKSCCSLQHYSLTADHKLSLSFQTLKREQKSKLGIYLLIQNSWFIFCSVVLMNFLCLFHSLLHCSLILDRATYCLFLSSLSDVMCHFLWFIPKFINVMYSGRNACGEIVAGNLTTALYGCMAVFFCSGCEEVALNPASSIFGSNVACGAHCKWQQDGLWWLLLSAA